MRVDKAKFKRYHELRHRLRQMQSSHEWSSKARKSGLYDRDGLMREIAQLHRELFYSSKPVPRGVETIEVVHPCSAKPVGYRSEMEKAGVCA